MFNKTVKPILLYGAEIWGFGKFDILERVQLKFLKHILKLKSESESKNISKLKSESKVEKWKRK